MSVIEIVKGMSFVELEALVTAARVRMEELRTSGVQALAMQFEEMAQQYGMSAAQLVGVTSGKRKRGRPSKKDAGLRLVGE